MPELPEVEVSRRGLLPHLTGRLIAGAVLRRPLRHPAPPGLGGRLAGLLLRRIERRGKYLLLDCDADRGGGWLILHLGMSGSLRIVPPGTEAGPHDHFDLDFGDRVMRLRDPRRFGTVVWHEGPDVAADPLLAGLGIEPLSDGFDGDWLYAATRRRSAPIKQVLMDAGTLVGVGNIYASESLFRAGISPLRPARRIGRDRCARLAAAIRETLTAAIAAGGSSVRDYVHSDGGSGWFQLDCAVYGRAGDPCRVCGTPVRTLRQGGRATFYCPRCQT